MSAGRWQRAADVFHAALDRPPAERAGFLASACGDDDALRAEVASLLAAHDAADGFLDRPAVADEPDLADEPVFNRGQIVGRYRIDDRVGRGGMGLVFRARDLRLDRDVAIKVVSPALASAPAARARLEREARAAAALSHPGIARVYALEDVDGRTVLVSEFVEGVTLRDELVKGVLPEPRAIATVTALVEALAAAHAAGLVHRDLKPDNVMRGTDGRIRVLDFGLVRGTPLDLGPDGARLTATGHVLGTPGYMSPEQLEGREVDARTDVYAVGVLLAELLTGRLPPAGATGPVTRGARRIAPGVAGIIARCLARDPDDRYPSAAELLADLRGLPAGSGSADRVGRQADRRLRVAAWWWKFHQGVLLLAYVAAVLTVWAIRSASPNVVADACLLGATIAATAGAVLRLHLWFVYATQPRLYGDLVSGHQRRLRGNDWLLALVLGAAAWLLVDDSALAAAALVGGAVALATASVVVEPATTRALTAAMQRPPST